MGWVRVGYRLIGLLLIQVWAFSTGLILYLLYSRNQKKHWHLVIRYTRYWGILCCWILNFKIKIEGNENRKVGSLIVANHVGTPDIFVLASCFETFFVSKFGIGSWPMIGKMAALGGTIFINRTKKLAVKDMVREIERRLVCGFSVTLFPEGGVSPNDEIQPFKSSAFEAAAKTHSHVQPVLITYLDNQKPSVACWRHITFSQHLYRLLKNKELLLTITILPSLQEADRRLLASKSQKLIEEKNQTYIEFCLSSGKFS